MSRKLYIIRHAQASKESFFPGDFFRTLDKAGYKESEEMASWFASEETIPELLISSTAIRAFSTSLVFAKHLHYPSEKILLKDAVYDASPEKLYRVISETEDKFKSIAIFGHNPGFTDLLNDLCGFTIDNLPTAGIASVSLQIKSWSKLRSGDGKLIYIEFP